MSWGSNGIEKRPVMVVADDAPTCRLLQTFLSERGYRAVMIGSGPDLFHHFHLDPPAAVILDIVLSGQIDGLETLAALKRIDRDIPVLILSGEGRTTTVVRAMKLGACDFVSKPFDERDLEALLASALRQRRGDRDSAALRSAQWGDHQRVLLGDSPGMVEVRDLIARVADSDVTVLILGESGTGKELIARAVHYSSARRDKAFIKVNCAALPDELLESELFGFECSASSGASHPKPGKFEFAHRGTIFLDEIGGMGPALQAKVLHVLQSGEFSRTGGKHDIQVDVRIVAASSRDIERAVGEGRFREDLFLRLNLVAIQVPPLRARRDEIPMLTSHFLDRYSLQYNRPRIEIGPDTMSLFMQHDWPSNVRELEETIKRAVVLGGDATVQKEMTLGVLHAGHRAIPAAATQTGAPARPHELPAPGPATARQTPAALATAAADSGNFSLKDISRSAAREAERELILRILQHTRWNRKATAEILGISYKALLYKIKANGFGKAS